MCYSRNCKYENYWGECEKPKYKPCPHAMEQTPEEREDVESEERDDD